MLFCDIIIYSCIAVLASKTAIGTGWVWVHSVCPLVMKVYFAKTVDSIEMPFGVVGWMNQKNHILYGVRSNSPSTGRGNLGEEMGCKTICVSQHSWCIG